MLAIFYSYNLLSILSTIEENLSKDNTLSLLITLTLPQAGPNNALFGANDNKAFLNKLKMLRNLSLLLFLALTLITTVNLSMITYLNTLLDATSIRFNLLVLELIKKMIPLILNKKIGITSTNS